MRYARLTAKFREQGRLSRRAIVATGAALLFGFDGGLKARNLQSEPSRTPLKLIELKISTRGDLMEFSTKELKCPAKSRVRLSFSNTAKYVQFDDNWVLIWPGFYDAVVATAQRAEKKIGFRNVIPASSRRPLPLMPVRRLKSSSMLPSPANTFIFARSPAIRRACGAFCS